MSAAGVHTEGAAGNLVIATGHRPLPTEPRSPADRDPFAALEEARARHAVRSPIVLKDPTPDAVAPETKRAQADVARYQAPAIVEDTEPDTAEDQQECGACRDLVHTLSSAGWCDGCEEELAQAATEDQTKPPTEGKQGKPTTRSSAPRANQASSTTGRAPVAGPSTHQGKNPEPVQETRPATGSGPLGVVEMADEFVDYAALLRATIDHADSRVQAAHRAVIACLDVLAQLATEQAPPSKPVKQPEPRPAPQQRAPRPPRPRTPRASTVDTAEVIRRYQDGETPPQIGRSLGCTAKMIRRALDQAGIQRRDDRAGHSGSQPKEYDPELVARVRRLYTLHGMTQADVAEQIGTSAKVVQNLMARHGIDAREPVVPVPYRNKLGPDAQADIIRRYQAGEKLRDIAADHGVSPEAVRQALIRHGVPRREPSSWNVTYSAAEVRAWARANGIDCPAAGRFLPTRIVDAYLTAHATEATT